MIKQHQAQTILRFLGRAQITGAEAPAFMECVMALRAIASQQTSERAPSTYSSATEGASALDNLQIQTTPVIRPAT
jgi:hypothetical protein